MNDWSQSAFERASTGYALQAETVGDMRSGVQGFVLKAREKTSPSGCPMVSPRLSWEICFSLTPGGKGKAGRSVNSTHVGE